MADYLVFTLAASLGAMGDLAGHERRGSWTWPGRGAVLGLLGAARGIRRDDAAGQAELNGLQMAVAIYDEGTPLRDYHTVQTIPTAAAKLPDSRRDAFRKAGLAVNTTITLRDYRAGSFYAVAVWGDGLERLAEALAEPVFTLYLGRKSCPLSVPPAAKVVTCDSVQAALQSVARPAWLPAGAAWRVQLIASDVDLGGQHSDIRNDQPLDRGKWHFTSRRVHYWRPDGTEALA
jgi:CRISPR system Cascade subunit CasD